MNWLVLDVDGVLTEGGITYDNQGVEQKRFHVRDGSGLKIWRHAGHHVAIITGRTSRVVELRAAELGIAPVLQGAMDKISAFRRFLQESDSRPEHVCAVMDDVPDLGVMRNCGVAVAVADACADVRVAADYVTTSPGGYGAVREVIEWILGIQGKWQPIVEQFQNQRL